MSILYRIPEKLKKALHIKSLPVEPAQEDPFLDWSVSLFSTQDSFDYILLVNTVTHYATLFQNPGINSSEEFGKIAAQGLRAQFLFFALRGLYNENIAPHVHDFRLSKTLDAKAISSNTSIVREAKWLLERNETIEEVCYKLNKTTLKNKEKSDNSYTPDQYMVHLYEAQKK